MDIKIYDDILKFFKKEVQSKYNSPFYCFSGLQKWAENYSGIYSKEVKNFVKFLEEKQKGEIRYFMLTDKDLEEILSKIF